MRRLMVLMGALLTLGFGATPASAQELRDPFDPLLSTGTGDTGTGDPSTGDTTPPFTAPDETPLVDPPPSSDDLPQTGTDPRSWMALAYVLLAAGGTLYFVGARREAVRSASSRGRPPLPRAARGTARAASP